MAPHSILPSVGMTDDFLEGAMDVGKDGRELGVMDGSGEPIGASLGKRDGDSVGAPLGIFEGTKDGSKLGSGEGC